MAREEGEVDDRTTTEWRNSDEHREIVRKKNTRKTWKAWRNRAVCTVHTQTEDFDFVPLVITRAGTWSLAPHYSRTLVVSRCIMAVPALPNCRRVFIVYADFLRLSLLSFSFFIHVAFHSLCALSTVLFCLQLPLLVQFTFKLSYICICMVRYVSRVRWKKTVGISHIVCLRATLHKSWILLWTIRNIIFHTSIFLPHTVLLFPFITNDFSRINFQSINMYTFSLHF